jgi:hypothetical protein
MPKLLHNVLYEYIRFSSAYTLRTFTPWGASLQDILCVLSYAIHDLVHTDAEGSHAIGL